MFQLTISYLTGGSSVVKINIRCSYRFSYDLCLIVLLTRINPNPERIEVMSYVKTLESSTILANPFKINRMPTINKEMFFIWFFLYSVFSEHNPHHPRGREKSGVGCERPTRKERGSKAGCMFLLCVPYDYIG